MASGGGVARAARQSRYEAMNIIHGAGKIDLLRTCPDCGKVNALRRSRVTQPEASSIKESLCRFCGHVVQEFAPDPEQSPYCLY